MKCRWRLNRGVAKLAQKGELEAALGRGLTWPKMAWRRGNSQIGARHDAIQSGEVAVETLAIRRTHEHEELMASARAWAPGDRDVIATIGVQQGNIRRRQWRGCAP